MSFLVADRGQLHHRAEPPAVVILRHALWATGPGVDLERINLRVPDRLGMCGLMVKHSANTGEARNILGSLLVAALGGDLNVVHGPLALVGWSKDDGQIVDLPQRFAVMAADVHAYLIAALTGGSSPYGQPWVASIMDMAHYLGTATLEQTNSYPVVDFFGRDKTKVRWWVCPQPDPCQHAGIWHERDYPHRCNIENCDCIAF